MELGKGQKLTCCGDEPYNDWEEAYAKESRWLLHEAFCLHSQAEVFKPYEKHHSTVKDACELAERLKVKICFYIIQKIKIYETGRAVIFQKERTIFMGIFIYPMTWRYWN